MLLSSFAFIHSASSAAIAVKVLTHRPGTPERQGIPILHDSPNTLLQKRGGSPLPEIRIISKTAGIKFFRLYIALHLSGHDWGPHITLVDQLVTESVKDAISAKLGDYPKLGFFETERSNNFEFPCDMTMKLRRDRETSTISPSRTVESAYATPLAAARDWLMASEELTGFDWVSQVLQSIDEISHLGHLGYWPLLHTQQSAFSGAENVTHYKVCHVELYRDPISRRQMEREQEKQRVIQEDLTAWLSKTNRYLYLKNTLNINIDQENKINQILAKIPVEDYIPVMGADSFSFVEEIAKNKRDMDCVISRASRIIDHMCDLIKARQCIPIDLSSEYCVAVQQLKYVKFFCNYSQQLYSELMQNERLRGSFGAIPHEQMDQCLIQCQRIAALRLNIFKAGTELSYA